MKILITGSCGFIGFYLSNELLKKGHQILGIDNLNNYYDINLKKERLSILSRSKNFKFYKTDINEMPNDIFNIDVGINLAAQAGVRLNKKEFYKYTHSNINGFNSFLNFCVKNDIKNILYASSSSIYGDSAKNCFSESDSLGKPNSFYAATKVFNENLAEVYSNIYNLNIYGMRFFTVYGPLGRPDMAYYKFTDQIYRNREIELFNDGEMARDMTYIDDVIDGITSLIQFCISNKNKRHELFNFGNNLPIRTKDLVSKIEEILNKKAKINNIPSSNEIFVTNANIDKSKKLLNYNPKISFDEGIKKFINWYNLKN